MDVYVEGVIKNLKLNVKRTSVIFVTSIMTFVEKFIIFKNFKSEPRNTLHFYNNFLDELFKAKSISNDCILNAHFSLRLTLTIFL